MFKKVDKNKIREARHYRQRKDIFGTADRPRLNVYRSTNHIYAQIINDEVGNTLVAASTMDAGIKSQINGKTKKEAAELVGKLIAERAADAGIKKVVFDRGGYLYTGRVSALAEGARKAGLDF